MAPFSYRQQIPVLHRTGIALLFEHINYLGGIIETPSSWLKMESYSKMSEDIILTIRTAGTHE